MAEGGRFSFEMVTRKASRQEQGETDSPATVQDWEYDEGDENDDPEREGGLSELGSADRFQA